MTAPRTPLFQRKGAPPVPSGGLPAPSDAPPMGHPGDAGAGGDMPPIQCQACGAMLNPADGAVVDDGKVGNSGPTPPGGGDMGAQLMAAMGGG